MFVYRVNNRIVFFFDFPMRKHRRLECYLRSFPLWFAGWMCMGFGILFRFGLCHCRLFLVSLCPILFGSFRFRLNPILYLRLTFELPRFIVWLCCLIHITWRVERRVFTRTIIVSLFRPIYNYISFFCCLLAEWGARILRARGLLVRCKVILDKFLPFSRDIYFFLSIGCSFLVFSGRVLTRI